MTASYAPCPVCDAEVPVPPNPVLSELLVCESCSVALEVRALDPVVLDEAPQEEEDWGQ
jgi:alpha-aminoadipate carrier protein LysW